MSGGTIVAGNVGIVVPPAALSAVPGQVATIAVQAKPANLPVPGGPAQYSPNGTVLDIQVTDKSGNRVTTFPAPIPLVFRYNAADLAMARGNPKVLTVGYFVDSSTPAIANPLHVPVGTLLFAPASATQLDVASGTVTFNTQAIGSIFGVVTNPVAFMQTINPNATEFSSFASDAQAFGTKPQFSYLQMVEPQIGGRLLVRDPDTGNFAYVNATDVGPSGPPPSVSTAVVRGLLAPFGF